ncbi:MAG: HipA N-terminal domain-containing protein [Eubacteriales bacterium]|nr:HipA N-terminal domain-containing protein [Eubacteriales bacterium]
MENTVKITLWNDTVGYLTWDNSDWRKESSVFKYDSSFLEKGLDISPLQMSINSPAGKAGIPIRGGNPRNLFKGLPPVFADSLPDHWGNSIFRAWAKEHNISMSMISPVDLLAFVGKRAMGALEYHPSFIDNEDEACEVNVQELYLFAKSILEERTKMTFSSDRELLWRDLVKLGTSPGGKRPKVLIAINRENGDIKSGQAMLPREYDYYVLKYDNESDTFPYARMEYIYWRLCRDAGIDMSDSELKRFDTASHFITKRFDRGPEGKIHMQSLLAMAGEVSSYEEAFDTMRKPKFRKAACQ